MAKTKQYQHFCPVARSLEVIGEKWSLLVVRDLLRGPQRFSDLMRYMGGITPKWLTQRLRDLEEAGIVERDSAPGRREVWYRLTPKGRDLAPVIRSLVVWGVEHAMRPPRPHEAVFPESVLTAMTIMLSERRAYPKRPLVWRFTFEDRSLLLEYDGAGWTLHPDDDGRPAAIELCVTARDWVEFLASTGTERAARYGAIQMTASRADRAEFERVFNVRPRAERLATSTRVPVATP